MLTRTLFRRFSTKVSIADIKKLRTVTSAPMSDCKKALLETNGDMGEAKKILIQKNLAKAGKKEGREQKEGVWGFLATPDRRQAVLLNLTCETDFVAKSEAFLDFCSTSLKVLLANFEKIDDSGESDELKQLLERTEIAAGAETSILEAKKLLIAKTEENILYSRVLTIEVPENEIVGYYCHRSISAGIGATGGFAVVNTQGNIEPRFLNLADDLAVHGFSLKPKYLYKDQIPAEELEAGLGALREEMAGAIKGKPQEIQDRIIEGKFNKVIQKDIMELQELGFVDSEETVGEYLAGFEKDTGVGVRVVSYQDFY